MRDLEFVSFIVVFQLIINSNKMHSTFNNIISIRILEFVI